MCRTLLCSAVLLAAWPGAPRAQAAEVPECEEAQEISSQPPSKNPARVRYEARLRLEACVKAGWKQGKQGDQQFAVQLAQPATPAKEAEADFMGLRLGIGVGFSYAFDDVVSQASVDAGGRIVAETRQRQLPRVILESHYYGLCRIASCNAGTFGIGPYVAIVAKSDKLISAFSAGVMFGWRDPLPERSQGLSVGIGAVLDDEVKSLASGFTVGQPLPAGETAVRYETKARWSGILFVTRTF